MAWWSWAATLALIVIGVTIKATVYKLATKGGEQLPLTFAHVRAYLALGLVIVAIYLSATGATPGWLPVLFGGVYLSSCVLIGGGRR